MAWFDEFNLPGATIDGYFGFIKADGPDDDDYPDVVIANGTVTFTATTEAARVDGAWLGIQPVTAQIFEGRIVISEEDPRPVRLLATDAPIGVADWAWKASFKVSGFRLNDLVFKAPRGTTVNLTADLIPIKSQPYQIIEGASIVDTEVDTAGERMRFKMSDGTFTDWVNVPNGEPGAKGDKGDKGDPGADGTAATLAMGAVSTGTTADAWMTGTPLARELNLTLPRGVKGEKGDKGDTPTWADLPGKPTVFPSAVASVDGLPQALNETKWGRGAVAAGTDLNALRTLGVWDTVDSAVTGSLLNRPPTTSAGVLEVLSIPGTSSSLYMQRYSAYGGSGADSRIWVRRTASAASGAWSPWRQLATTDEIAPPVATALAAKMDVEAVELASGTDLNSLVLPGVLYESNTGDAQAGANFPEAVAGVLAVTSNATRNHVQQQYTTYGPTTRRYIRGRYAGSWSPWKQIITSDDPRLTDARQPKTHDHDDRYYTEAEIDQKLAGLVGPEGPQGPEGPYGGTEVSDPQVASYIAATGSATRAALDEVYAGRVSVEDFGATGDGTTDDTAAFTAALESGHPLTVPAGTYLVSGAEGTKPLDLELQQGAVIRHLAADMPAIHVTGTEHPTVPVTVDVGSPAKTITAPGHGLAPGDWFRLASDRQYDSRSTYIMMGELLQVHEVAGDVITPRTPVQGGPYQVADSATVSKIDMVHGVRIHGRGVIEGAFTVGPYQTGVKVSLAQNVQVQGVMTRGFDWRHYGFQDCSDVHVVGCEFEWTRTTGTGYGVAPVNATQDVLVERCIFTDVRHAFTTTNEVGIRGVVRRATVQNSTIRYTRPHEGGTYADALDTHTAAEEISFLNNRVVGAVGIGINHECRSGKIIGNVIIDAASHGISVHNETDYVGSIEVRDNRIIRPGSVGIRILAASRGSTAPTEGVFITGNYLEDVAGAQVIRVGMDSYPVMRGVIITGNVSKGATSSDFIRTWNTEMVHEAGNLAISGGSSITITGRAA